MNPVLWFVIGSMAGAAGMVLLYALFSISREWGDE